MKMSRSVFKITFIIIICSISWGRDDTYNVKFQNVIKYDWWDPPCVCDYYQIPFFINQENKQLISLYDFHYNSVNDEFYFEMLDKYYQKIKDVKGNVNSNPYGSTIYKLKKQFVGKTWTIRVDSNLCHDDNDVEKGCPVVPLQMLDAIIEKKKLKKVRAYYKDFDLGDSGHYGFVTESGTYLDFQRNLDDNEIILEKPTNEPGYQGLKVNEYYLDKLFDITYYEKKCGHDDWPKDSYIDCLFIFSIEPVDKSILSNNIAIEKEIIVDDKMWMSNNLNVDTFRNGDIITQAKSEEEWMKASHQKKPMWKYTNYSSTDQSNQGKLYNWFAVNDERGLAPLGYTIPTKDDWNYLFNFIGSNISAFKTSGAGSEWWSSTEKYSESDLDSAWGSFMYNNGTKIGPNYFEKGYGCYVRCIKDTTVSTDNF
jgi:Fibrobacter succinogenes major domain (Fib_succ_major)